MSVNAETNTLLFTRAGYAQVLTDALEAATAFSPSMTTPVSSEGPVCLLRHDVDVDPGAALDLARDRSRPRRAFDLLPDASIAALQRVGPREQHARARILSLGHWLGLHFDVSFMPGDDRERGGVGAVRAADARRELRHRGPRGFLSPAWAEPTTSPARVRGDGAREHEACRVSTTSPTRTRRRGHRGSGHLA